MTSSKAAARIAIHRDIGAAMAAAILSGTGAVVEVTLGRPGVFIVSGTPDACKAAEQVMVLAGGSLISSEWDAEFGAQFDYYRKG